MSTAETTEVTVRSDDTEDNYQVEVLKVGELLVENLQGLEEAEQEEKIEVSADIVNTGDIELTQDIDFKVDEEVKETEEDLTVDDSEHVSFEYFIPSEQDEDIEVEIATEGDEVIVQKDIYVELKVENTGDVTEETEVELYFVDYTR